MQEHLGWLYIDMYEHGFVEETDLLLARAWLRDLINLRGSMHMPSALHYPPKKPSLPPCPEVEILVRMCSRFSDEAITKLLVTQYFFLPTFNITVVLDEEDPNNNEVVARLSKVVRPPSSVKFKFLPPNPRAYTKGHKRQMFDDLFADELVDKEFVGIVDTDTAFVTQVTKEDLFDGDKPRVFGVIGVPSAIAPKFWERVPATTEYAFGLPYVFRPWPISP